MLIGDTFHLKPLLRLLSAGEYFYVLALSQNVVRLFRGTRDQIEEVHVPTMPASLAEALQYDDPEKQHQFHTMTPPVGGGKRRPAIHFGHAASTDEEATNLLRYFQQVDDGLHRWLPDERTPLVLAGVEYLHPIYHEASHYPGLLAQGLTGNPEQLRPDELHAQAWRLVEPLFTQGRANAVALYRQVAGAGGQQASSDLKVIVPAAHIGRIETLFVEADAERWGRFDPLTQTIHLHAAAEPGDQDLLDFAAAHTLINSGTVYAGTAAEMPDSEPAVAILRY